MQEIIVQIVNFVTTNPIGAVAIILSLTILIKVATPLFSMILSKIN